MATGGTIEITDGHKCPVCLGEYDLPKVLPCNHVFCKGCLEQWLNNNKLQCPVCTQETVFNEKLEVAKLPELMIIKDETEKVTTFLSMGTGMGVITKMCGMCKKTSSYFCESCHKNLCDVCQRKHKTTKCKTTHKLRTVSKLTVCPKHPDELITFYCCDCCQGLCTLCADTSHLEDQVIDINNTELVKGKKDKLMRFTSNLQHSVRTLKEHKIQVRKSITSLADSYDRCEHGLIQVREEVVQNIDQQVYNVRQDKSAEMMRFVLYEEEIENMIATRNSLETLVKGLQDTAADIVLSADNLPDISSNTVPVTPNYRVPLLRDNVTELINNAKSLITTVSSGAAYSRAETGDNEFEGSHIGVGEINVGKKTSKAYPHCWPTMPTPMTDRSEITGTGSKAFSKAVKHGSKLSGTSRIISPSDLASVPRLLYMHRSDINVGSYVWDITYDCKEAGWWVRTKKPELLNLGLDGKIDTRMKKHIPNDNARICIDTKRDQLILVDQKQGLVCLSKQGNLIRNINIPDDRLVYGVTYCPNRDVFVVTDLDNHCLWFVSSDSGKVLQKLGSKGSGDKQFNDPLFLCHQNVGEAECNIVVSDSLNHCIKLFTCMGEFIRKVGTRGTGYQQLQFPRGICADPWGRVIVADFNNFRVVCFWWDGAEKFEVLLNKEQLGGEKPRCVSVSDDGKQLMAGMYSEESIIKIFDIKD